MAESAKHGLVELLILSILSKGEQYGYKIAAEINRGSQGHLSITEPSLYTMLRKLVNFGYIAKRDDGVLVKGKLRIYYSITPTGLERLVALWRELDYIMIGVYQIKKTLKK